MNRTSALLALILAASPLSLTVSAQNQPGPVKAKQPAIPAPASEPKPADPDSAAINRAILQYDNKLPIRFFYLKSSNSAADGNEIMTSIRNFLDPTVKTYLVPSRNAIGGRMDEANFERMRQIIDALDRPKPSVRLTYTLTEIDGGKRVGTQHITLVAADGQRVTLKQGSKVPVVTGSYVAGSASSQTQMTYLDVGLNVDATFSGDADGGTLKSKVEQSGLAEEKSTVGSPDPVVRQSVLEGVAILKAGKPVILGSVDVPGSTRHLDIEVMEEPLK